MVTASRKPGGSNPREAAEDKAPQTPGNTRNLKESGQRSLGSTECSTHWWKKRKSAWTKSGRESATREAHLYDMREKAVTDEKKEESDRDKLGDKLETFLKKERRGRRGNGSHGRNEEKRGSCTTKKLWGGAKSMQRSARMSKDTTEIRAVPGPWWQNVGSQCRARDTKNMNLEKDLEDIQSTEHTKGRRNLFPNSRWYSKIVGKRLQIPSTHSKAETNRREGTS